MKLKTARAEDAAAITAIENECFSDPYSDSLIIGALSNPMSLVALILCDDTPAGYAEFGNYIDTVSLNRIAILPQYRRRGAALALLGAGEEFARSAGADRLCLEVRESNTAAAALYLRAGYCQSGRRRRYYRSPEEDALLFEKLL